MGQTVAHTEFQACSAEVCAQRGKLCVLHLEQYKACAAAIHEHFVNKLVLLTIEVCILATGVHVCLDSDLGIVNILAHG
jgi:hypothetical protein